MLTDHITGSASYRTILPCRIIDSVIERAVEPQLSTIGIPAAWLGRLHRFYPPQKPRAVFTTTAGLLSPLGVLIWAQPVVFFSRV